MGNSRMSSLADFCSWWFVHSFARVCGCWHVPPYNRCRTWLWLDCDIAIKFRGYGSRIGVEKAARILIFVLQSNDHHTIFHGARAIVQSCTSMIVWPIQSRQRTVDRVFFVWQAALDASRMLLYI